MQPMSDRQESRNDILMNGLKGAIAGAVGVWVMDRLDWFMFRHEDQRARHLTEQVRPDGLDPAHAAVKKVANAFGTELTPAQLDPAGLALHYALGIGPAAAYGALRERLPAPPQGQDLLYGLGLGLGLFLIQDEGLNQAMGISAKQKEYPWQAHARGFVAHMTLGLVTNAVLNVLGAPRPSGKRTTRPSPRSTDYQEYQSQDLMPRAHRTDVRGAGAALH